MASSMASREVKPSPLQSAAANESLFARRPEAAVWNGQVCQGTFHLFLNETHEEVDLYWFHDAGEVMHGSMAPKGNLYIGTHTFHQWKVKSKKGNLLGVYAGASATVTIHPSGCIIKHNSLHGEDDNTTPSPGIGRYQKRGAALGMPILAFDCVPDEAVQRAAHVVSRMLEHSPPEVLERMVHASAAVAIVGRNQVMSDLPPHSFMKHNSDRNLDKTCRGLGATTTIPVTSVGEENLTMVDDRIYPCQSILVHEMGHAVLNLALTDEQVKEVCELFNAALCAKTFPPDCYMMSNEQEYWATATEAWFNSTIRTDVNGGVCNREKLLEVDPGLGKLMIQAFGDGSWRYPDDCPEPLRMPTWRDRQAAKQEAAAVAATAAAAVDAAAAAVAASGVHLNGNRRMGGATSSGNSAGSAGTVVSLASTASGGHGDVQIDVPGDEEMDRQAGGGSAKRPFATLYSEGCDPFLPRWAPISRCLALGSACLPRLRVAPLPGGQEQKSR